MSAIPFIMRLYLYYEVMPLTVRHDLTWPHSLFYTEVMLLLSTCIVVLIKWWIKSARVHLIVKEIQNGCLCHWAPVIQSFKITVNQTLCCFEVGIPPVLFIRALSQCIRSAARNQSRVSAVVGECFLFIASELPERPCYESLVR